MPEPSQDSALEGPGNKAAQLLNDLNDISFFDIGLIVLLTWLAIVFVRKALPLLAQRGPGRIRLFLLGSVPILRLTLITIAILSIIPLVFNVTLQNFLIIAGGVSVAIGFAFKDYVSSLVAGVVAVFEKPYRPGDWVKINGDYGEVTNVGMRAITIVTAADDTISIPNLQLWTANVANSNDGQPTLMCVANFWIKPEHDASALRFALDRVALTSAYLDYSRPVFTIVEEKPWGTHYKLKAYPYDMRDQFLFISDLTARGKLAIAQAGAEAVMAPVAVQEESGTAAPAPAI